MKLPTAKKHPRFPVAKAGQNYTLRANQGGKHLDVYLYGVIGSWWSGANLESLRYELKKAGKVNSIDVYINTIGGTFYDGLPIYNTLKSHSAFVTTKVMGYALSMGSVIMLAGDKIEAAENSLIMMHNAQGFAWGSAANMLKQANILQKHEQAIIPAYARRMNRSETDVQTFLDEETWFTATEARSHGLIDNISDPVDLEETDGDLEADDVEFAIDNYLNPPAMFTNRLQARLAEDQRKHQPLLSRLLKMAVGEPQTPLNTDMPAQDEIDMTNEELQAMLAQNNQQLAELMDKKMDERLGSQGEDETHHSPSEPVTLEQVKAALAKTQDDLKTVNQSLADKDKVIADLKAELDQYKLPDPDKNTLNVPENTGPDKRKDYSHFL